MLGNAIYDRSYEEREPEEVRDHAGVVAGPEFPWRGPLHSDGRYAAKAGREAAATATSESASA